MKTIVKGLFIFTHKGKIYCGVCGMPVVHSDEWKELHLKYHEKQKGAEEYQITMTNGKKFNIRI
jgi:hypothetical protein